VTIQEEAFSAVVRVPYSKGAWIRNDFPGFREDYLVVHSLIRRYGPRRIMEIGTSTGRGTNVLCRAVGLRRFGFRSRGRAVLSIDVPAGTDPSILYPDKEDGHPSKAGMECRYPYTQLFGDSSRFDFTPYYPIDAWFIDGKHDYAYASRDTRQALASDPSLVIWHDMQMDGVAKAVEDTMSGAGYEVRRVAGTRVAYAVKTGAE